MSDPLFQEAYARARRRFTDNGWLALNPREITEAIYREIREIDAERLAARGPVDSGEQVGTAKRTVANRRPGRGSETAVKGETLRESGALTKRGGIAKGGASASSRPPPSSVVEASAIGVDVCKPRLKDAAFARGGVRRHFWGVTLAGHARGG